MQIYSTLVVCPVRAEPEDEPTIIIPGKSDACVGCDARLEVPPVLRALAIACVCPECASTYARVRNALGNIGDTVR